MTLVVRAMTASDVRAVVELERRTPCAPHWPLSAYQACAEPQPAGAPVTADQPIERLCLVAEQGGAVTGFAVARLAAGVCELESIVVAEEARRQGTGGALMRSLMRIAASRGAQALELEVRASNRAALRLYERFGGSVAGRRPRYYSDPVEDGVLMSIPIQS